MRSGYITHLLYDLLTSDSLELLSQNLALPVPLVGGLDVSKLNAADTATSGLGPNVRDTVTRRLNHLHNIRPGKSLMF